MKLTMPLSILISSFLLALAIMFRLDSMPFIPLAKAGVAGMSYFDLKYDYDFKRAVQSIVEDCNVSGNVSGWVDGVGGGDYIMRPFSASIDSADISC